MFKTHEPVIEYKQQQQHKRKQEVNWA